MREEREKERGRRERGKRGKERERGTEQRTQEIILFIIHVNTQPYIYSILCTCVTVSIYTHTVLYYYLEVIPLFFLPNPGECLLLRINTQRIPAGLCGEDTILYGELVRREGL